MKKHKESFMKLNFWNTAKRVHCSGRKSGVFHRVGRAALSWGYIKAGTLSYFVLPCGRTDGLLMVEGIKGG